MNKNGSYHYEWDIGSPGIFTDVFTYTLKDNDGSLSHATITINISPNAGGGLTATSGLILMNDSGTGSDTFIVSAPEQLNASEPVSGTGEAATADILRIAGTGAYDLAASHVTNIDALVLSKNAAGSSIIVGDTMVSTADFNKDGAGGDLQISAVPMSGEVTIDASSLTGSNHIVVDSLNFGGNDIFKGGAGDDTLTGGAGSDTLTGGAGADHFKYISTSDGGTFANPLGADHIVDFNAAQGDVIDILGAAFGNIAPGANVAAIFGSSAGDTFGSPAEQFHYNTETHTLLYDSNGSDTGGVQTTLAVFDNHAIVAATNIHVI
jgi:Ca2+-binding RTX toxin-like protein